MAEAGSSSNCWAASLKCVTRPCSSVVMTAEAMEALFGHRLEDFYTELAHHYSRSANVHKLVHFLDWHTPFAWLVLAAVLASVALAVARAPGARLGVPRSMG